MKNLLPVDVDFSKLEARLWAEKKTGSGGWKGGWESRGLCKMFEEQGILNNRCGERKKEQVGNTEGLH